MAFRVAMQSSVLGNMGCKLGFRRWTHAIISQSAPLDSAINNPTTVSPPLVLPESHRDSWNNNTEFEFPSFSFGGGSLEVMAVPKRKVSPHRKGIRNGPKALKPIPVIVRCKGCGRVKLPHFFCCSGDRGNTGGQNASTR
ncbi:uncharacterized protein LOC132302853 [Cornus florida]|uniref:uncharacterized protein LOC132302853 n=1 Tax=Cornus florida TaxID=4283 RepID=UPI00289F7049|nr:uncharacterized protein LOC132302853 [Cornus florida]